MYFLTEESLDEMKENLLRHGWDIDIFEKEAKLRVLDIFRKESRSLKNLLRNPKSW